MTEELLNRQQAAERIGVSVITFDRRAKARQLTKYKGAGGSHVRYLASDVDSLVLPDKLAK